MKKYLISSILIATAPFVVFADTGSESYPSTLYVAVTVVNNNPLSNQPIVVNSQGVGTAAAIQFTTIKDESDIPITYEKNAILEYQFTKISSGRSDFWFWFTVSNGKDNCYYKVMGSQDAFNAGAVETKFVPSSADFCQHLLREAVPDGNTYNLTINYNANVV